MSAVEIVMEIIGIAILLVLSFIGFMFALCVCGIVIGFWVNVFTEYIIEPFKDKISENKRKKLEKL